MNVPPVVLAHKTLMIALVALGRHVADALGLATDMPVATMARELGANRTAVYEQMDRLVRAMAAMVATGPGRPRVDVHHCDEARIRALELTTRVQAFRLEHRDAVIKYPSRTAYSASFRRLILAELDGWPGARVAFAEAAGVPDDTLADWVDDDRRGLAPAPPERRSLAVPVDASATTRAIVEEFQTWEGSTKAFLGISADSLGLTPSQVAKVLRICGAIAPRPWHRFRHRGATEVLSPGAMLVTDGKTLDVELTGSGRRMQWNWQGIVDQATGCDTAAVVSRHEDAAAVRAAFFHSVTFLGGVAPDGLLHDHKPCYFDAGLRGALAAVGTQMVAATPARPENKAILEGAYSLFETRVGTIYLDDTDRASLIHSAVGEVVRAHTAATNGLPRAELGGLSREATLRAARPSAAKQAANRAFIRDLKERHDRASRSQWRKRVKAASRRLLDHVFARLELEHLDPHGRLREYLATFEPAAIRQAVAVVAVRLERGELELTHAHRYLTKVIQAQQECLDLERHAAELLALCRLEAQDWVAEERADLETLQRDCEPEVLATALAERAACGGLPVTGAFWTERLLAFLAGAEQLIDPVRRFLIRLYEAPPERRLFLLDRLTALQQGLA
jgi:hypothetical protein